MLKVDIINDSVVFILANHDSKLLFFDGLLILPGWFLRVDQLVNLDVAQTCLDRFVKVILRIFTVDVEQMELEEIEVEEGHSNCPTPVEEEVVELLGLKQSHKQQIPLPLRNDVRHLVQEPEHFCCRSPMVKFQKNANPSKEEVKVKVWRNQALVFVNSHEPQSNQLKWFNDGCTVVYIRFLEHRGHEGAQ